MNKRLFIFGIVLILLSSFVSGALIDNLEAYYKADTGGVYPDSENSYDGTILGATYTTSGKINGAYVFDGGNDKITLHNNLGTAIDGTAQTMYGWFKINSISDKDPLFTDRDGVAPNQMLTAMKDSDTVYYAIGSGCWAWNEFDFLGLNLLDGNWHFLAFRHDGTTAIVNVDDYTKQTLSCSGAFVSPNLLQIGYEPNQLSYYDGVNDENAFFSRVFSDAEILEVYNSGNGLPYPLTGTIEITLINEYNSSSINTFTADINGTHIHTTNGIINYTQNQLVNITYYNISGVEGVYFNRTYLNVNTSTNFQGEVWQSTLILYATDSVGTLILNFNASASADLIQFNVSNVTGNVTFHLNTQEYNITGSAENYNDNATLSINTTAVSFTFGVLTFPLNIINVTAIDKQNNNPILVFNVSVNGGTFFNSTTMGWTIVPCPTPTCNVDINSTLFIPQSYTNHDANDDFQANLTNRTSNFYFYNAKTNSPIVTADVTIVTPQSRTLELTTDSSGRISFTVMNEDSFDQGNYSITLESFGGYITPITFYRVIDYNTAPENTTFNITSAFIIVNLWDRETGAVFTKETIVILQNYVNGTTTNGTFIIQNLTISAGDLSIYALSTGYSTEQVTFTYTSQDNITVDLYLLNSTGSNTGTHFVSALDEFYITQPDALIELSEYDISLGSFIKVSECITNSNGECSFIVELGQKKYIITGTKTIDGRVFTDSTSSAGLFITVDNDFTELFLKLSTEFQTTKSTQLNYIITNNVKYLNNATTNTSSINITFSTYDGGSTIICIEYFNVSGGNSASFNQTCSIGSSGTIQTSINLDRSFNYNIEVYQLHDGYKILLFSKSVNKIFSFGKALDDAEFLNPFILVPHILLLAFAFRTRRILLFFIGEPFIMWFEVLIFPSIALTSVAVLITVICFYSGKNALKKRTEIQ